MGIRLFIYVLFIISIISLFTNVSSDVKYKKHKDIALVTFNDSTMYTLDEKNVSRIVQSKEAKRFKKRDEMYEGTFIVRAKSKNTSSLTDIISADFIEKKGNKLKFENHVKYNRDDFISLSTDILYYNTKTKIAYNNKPFIGKYYNNFLIGEKFHVDTNKTYFKSQKAHFEIDLDEKYN